ncbi:TIGR01906 family membrane protein [Arthrobacter sp. NPDC090010]|uniref:TIGR01906 family membrane protein n=1 Tax=Arthrobacter sp. NPDC090010 TaxID=3363942 RepID=UPI0038201394
MSVSEKKPNEEPVWDNVHDSDEPAFEWMKNAQGDGAERSGEKPGASEPSGDVSSDGEVPAGSNTASDSSTLSEGASAESPAAGAALSSTDSAADETSDSAVKETGGAATETPEAGDTQERSPAADGDAPTTPDTEAEALSSEAPSAAVLSAEAPSTAALPPSEASSASETEAVAVVQEPLPTSALTLRAPENEVKRRQAARDAALAAKPAGPRVVKILSTIFLPLLLVITAVRVVATPLFLWLEYIRPGFPADGYGFSQEDRITYGSYAVDYLSNFSGPRYLGDLVTASGSKLFRDPEISHMADVKTVTMTTWGIGAGLAILALVAIWYLASRRDGSLRQAFFSASIVTLVVIVALGVLGFLGWDSFFTSFHELFFANGTWTFSLQDTLIRLFPGQFWIDAAATIAGLVFLTSLVTLIVTWPTKRRRESRKVAIAARLAAQQAAVAGD